MRAMRETIASIGANRCLSARLLSVSGVASHIESAFSLRGEIICGNPLCNITFPPSALKIEPRHHCSDQCRQTAPIPKRAAKLLDG